MKISLKILPWAINLFLLLVIFLQRECQRYDECPEAKTITKYIYDTIPYTPEAIKPKPGKIIERPLPAIIDSLAVAKAYFAVREGEDTLVNDSLYMMSLKWKVTENAPFFYQPTIIDRKPTTIISHTITADTWHIYAGFQMQYSMNLQTTGIGAAIALQTKKKNLYNISYDPFTKTGQIGMFWRIK